MTATAKHREQFLVDAAKEGMHIDTARALLREAATLTRLAEAQCNGDYPADNGQRPTKECHSCATLWAPESLNKADICPDCRATARALKLVPEGWSATFSGDPRGCVVTLKSPSGREIGVP